MSVRQLNQLQECDLEIESTDKLSALATAKLNENEELRRAKALLAKSQSELDALEALKSLGYSQNEAREALKKTSAGADTNAKIREALKILAGK